MGDFYHTDIASDIAHEMCAIEFEAWDMLHNASTLEILALDPKSAKREIVNEDAIVYVPGQGYYSDEAQATDIPDVDDGMGDTESGTSWWEHLRSKDDDS